MAIPAGSSLENPQVYSPHVSDSALRPFLQDTFDPAAYFNSTLPALSTHTTTARSAASGDVTSLSELSSQTQILLAQLNAHTTRLTAVLTQLTDDILRAGGRLAYQVEVLRGEALGLAETLSDGLDEHVAHFVPQGLKSAAAATSDETHETPPTEPGHITQLRTLTHVRQRLESVIKVFGEAMQWTIPPSEVSLTASLISVSAPEPGADSASREEKGREFGERLRGEIADLIVGAEDRRVGCEAAMTRIAALRDLGEVWKGTAEEKARVRFVEGLMKLAEERLKELERETEPQRRRERAASLRRTKGEKGGFLDNLQRMLE
ncbi:hypothetical protein EJ06DRAFT_533227 [Trichodelitschia bisporula]|uniref:Uncharacterized protein n=1 Tax=Trichodelitschia bisporula TaxID=703511 RepID=A0A6G1HPD7_9PEZI|nr:hypothetical protein EJ06DRAFT_533227 [Trichodelitschia bisporula]